MSGQTYDFNLLNTGTTSWQSFELVATPGTTFVGGATIGEITAHCTAGQPDGEPNEIECGPLSGTGLAPGVRVGFIATVSGQPACTAQFQLAVGSNSAVPLTPAGSVTSASGCSAVTPSVTKPPTVRALGKRLVATPPRWSTAPTRVSYQWQRCTGTRCVAIRGATALTIAPGARDAGHTVRIVATGTFASGTLASDSAKIQVRAMTKTS